jgi:hypothetical protein
MQDVLAMFSKAHNERNRQGVDKAVRLLAGIGSAKAISVESHFFFSAVS